MDAVVSAIFTGVGEDCAAEGLCHSRGTYDIPWQVFPVAAMLVSTFI